MNSISFFNHFLRLVGDFISDVDWLKPGLLQRDTPLLRMFYYSVTVTWCTAAKMC